MGDYSADTHEDCLCMWAPEQDPPGGIASPNSEYSTDPDRLGSELRQWPSHSDAPSNTGDFQSPMWPCHAGQGEDGPTTYDKRVHQSDPGWLNLFDDPSFSLGFNAGFAFFDNNLAGTSREYSRWTSRFSPGLGSLDMFNNDHMGLHTERDPIRPPPLDTGQPVCSPTPRRLDVYYEPESTLRPRIPVLHPGPEPASALDQLSTCTSTLSSSLSGRDEYLSVYLTVSPLKGRKLRVEGRVADVAQSWVTAGFAKRIRARLRTIPAHKLSLYPSAGNNLDSTKFIQMKVWDAPVGLDVDGGNPPIVNIPVVEKGPHQSSCLFVVGRPAQKRLGLRGPSAPSSVATRGSPKDSVATQPSDTPVPGTNSRSSQGFTASDRLGSYLDVFSNIDYVSPVTSVIESGANSANPVSQSERGEDECEGTPRAATSTN